MRRNAITRIILNSILALTLTGILISGLTMGGLNFIFTLGSNGTVVEGEVTFEASRIKNLEIDWVAGSVQIRAADTDRITVSESRPKDNKYKLTYKLSGNTLELDYAGGAVSIGFGNWSMPSKDLIITVPKDWVCGALEIDGASLDIELQDLNVGKIDLDGASCTLDFVGKVDSVDIDGASADITLNCANRISAINVDGASCDLKVILPKECGFLVEMDGLSCSFYSSLDYSQGNGSYSLGDRHCKVNVDGVSCDVTIQENPIGPITG